MTVFPFIFGTISKQPGKQTTRINRNEWLSPRNWTQHGRLHAHHRSHALEQLRDRWIRQNLVSACTATCSRQQHHEHCGSRGSEVLRRHLEHEVQGESDVQTVGTSVGWAVRRNGAGFGVDGNENDSCSGHDDGGLPKSRITSAQQINRAVAVWWQRNSFECLSGCFFISWQILYSFYMLSKYRNILGEPEKGFHEATLFGLAAWDLIGTALIAYVIAVYYKLRYICAFVGLFIFAQLLHLIFGVDTRFIKFIKGIWLQKIEQPDILNKHKNIDYSFRPIIRS